MLHKVRWLFCSKERKPESSEDEGGEHPERDADMEDTESQGCVRGPEAGGSSSGTNVQTKWQQGVDGGGAHAGAHVIPCRAHARASLADEAHACCLRRASMGGAQSSEPSKGGAESSEPSKPKRKRRKRTTGEATVA